MFNYGNPVLDKLPHHLRQYVVKQNYAHYTPIDHAVWRYVMQQNYSYLKDVAYYPYIPGLKKAGLTIEYIPDLQTMNDHLKQFGWGAATVNGFIPSQAFMEFQAYRVLVIAADIRQIEHIEYTPAPDIIHESAGHAPIIGEEEYAAYLQLTGEVGTKAMISEKDYQLFEAIRHLAVLKELHGTPESEIVAAEASLLEIQSNMGEPSEMALLSRLHWWTVEYGLIGTLDNPKIYGAGLLSSIGESVTCMQPEVRKLLYTIDAVNYAYDITKPQPQLFVTPDFQNLVDVLHEFSNTLSYKIGGEYGLKKATECRNVCTVIYSSGLQVSGIFSDKSNIHYIQTESATALSFADKQLNGHGKYYHKDGFGSPVGKLKNHNHPIDILTPDDLKNIGIELNKKAQLYFESGIQVEGILEHIERKNGKIILLSFSDCTVRNENDGNILFRPEWGIYDMAVGENIISVFSGAADKDAYEQTDQIPKDIVMPQYNSKTLELHKLYQTIRTIRENKTSPESLIPIWENIQNNYPKDWLAPLEILEILSKQNIYANVQKSILEHLDFQKTQYPEYRKLIDDGVKILLI